MPATQLPAGVPFESNPYPALIPFALKDTIGVEGYEFFRTLIETIRERHNGDTSGGTTFSWTLLTVTTQQQLYLPGALGRFLHPVYGMIQARYCQLVGVTPGLNTGGPVSAQPRGGIFNWSVSPGAWGSRTIGLLGSYTQFAEGDFGWVIERGINIQSVKYTGTAPIIGSRLTRDTVTLDALKVAAVGDQWVATLVGANAAGGVINPATLLIHC